MHWTNFHYSCYRQLDIALFENRPLYTGRRPLTPSRRVFYGRWRESLRTVLSRWCGDVSGWPLLSYLILCWEKWPLLYWIEMLNHSANTSHSSHVEVHPENHCSLSRAGTTLWYLVWFCLGSVALRDFLTVYSTTQIHYIFFFFFLFINFHRRMFFGWIVS